VGHGSGSSRGIINTKEGGTKQKFETTLRDLKGERKKPRELTLLKTGEERGVASWYFRKLWSEERGGPKGGGRRIRV